jgi:L-aminopeptidase/D-esterase-like protein
MESASSIVVVIATDAPWAADPPRLPISCSRLPQVAGRGVALMGSAGLITVDVDP